MTAQDFLHRQFNKPKNNQNKPKKPISFTWVFPLKQRTTRKYTKKQPSIERSEDFLCILQNRVTTTKRKVILT